tara:strand:+ start:314 stop:817 length:504 start_codon:yes stop_codon:yes gene_type:complete
MTLTTERQTYLLRLRRTGHSVANIAEMMDVTPNAVSSALKGAYSKLHAEHEAIEARDLELTRLDEMQSSFYETACEGDPKAADVVFKAMDRRAKLLGLDAPEQKKIETNFTIGWLDDDEPTIINAEFSSKDGTGDGGSEPVPSIGEDELPVTGDDETEPTRSSEDFG